jgi:hypothetical protein
MVDAPDENIITSDNTSQSYVGYFYGAVTNVSHG